MKSSQPITFEIRDINGKLIRLKNVGVLSGQTKQSIDISDIAKGTYLLKISGEATSETKKIIIE